MQATRSERAGPGTAHANSRDVHYACADTARRRSSQFHFIFWRTLVQKTASAKWSGGIKDGKGFISTQTGVLNEAPYGFKSRFEEGPGTNPEELIGAAHAGCFTMALSLQLEMAGMKAESLETKSTVTLEKDGEGFTITACQLDLKAKIPGADKAAFDKAAQAAKEGCPVSKLFAGNAKITLNAELVS
jgi:osmotically inducible protein OsmC